SVRNAILCTALARLFLRTNHACADGFERPLFMVYSKNNSDKNTVMKNSRRDFLQKMAVSAATLPFLSRYDAFANSGLRPLTASQAPPLRVALMGLGGYASRVAEAMQSCKRAKITGLISGTPQKLADWGTRFGVPEGSRYNYENFDRIKDNPDIDAVYVITPNALHHSQVIRVANAGKHVICEKPMALNAAEGQEMVDVCAKAGVKLLIGYRMHFEPKTVEVVRMRAAGEFGTIK